MLSMLVQIIEGASKEFLIRNSMYGSEEVKMLTMITTHLLRGFKKMYRSATTSSQGNGEAKGYYNHR
jgi:hypothetical protein